MRKSTRTLLAAALVLGVASGPALAPAFAAAPPAAAAPAAAPSSPDLSAAIAGLPRADATAALVRVGGTAGSWQGSSGVHDLETNAPADPAARFRAGSVTKVFTAATVLQLAAEGRIDLDRTARSYLPDLIPGRYATVTVRQLLNHTHGIPAAAMPGETVEEWYANRFVVHRPEEMVRSATAQPREFRPGTRQHYLNIGYTVAGLIVERVTGDTYEHQVERRILRPLGLRDTYFPGEAAEITGPYNHGYQTMRLDDGTTGLRDVSVWGTTDGWAAGDIVSTTADLERLGGARSPPGGDVHPAEGDGPEVGRSCRVLRRAVHEAARRARGVGQDRRPLGVQRGRRLDPRRLAHPRVQRQLHGRQGSGHEPHRPDPDGGGLRPARLGPVRRIRAGQAPGLRRARPRPSAPSRTPGA